MASPTGFGAAADADAALRVPRRPRARGLGPGVHVSVRASVFGEDYAKGEFGASWKTARVFGTIRHANGGWVWGRCATVALRCRCTRFFQIYTT